MLATPIKKSNVKECKLYLSDLRSEIDSLWSSEQDKNEDNWI